MKIVRASIFPVAALLAVAALPTRALQPDAPRFMGEEALPAAGVVVPVMQGSAQTPAKPVEVVRYRCRLGDREWEEERSNADELWVSAQRLAAWTDRKGNRIAFARVLAELPLAYSGMDVTRETFERALQDPDNVLDQTAEPERLALWARHFAATLRALEGGGTAGALQADGMAAEASTPADMQPETIPVNLSRFAKILSVPLPDAAERAFLLRLNPHHPGHGRAPRDWFAFFVRFASAPRPGDRDADRSLRSDFLGNLRTTGWRDTEKAVREASARRLATGVREEDIPDDPLRRQARDSVALLDDWWYMESPSYILLSDDPAAERSADALLGALESLRPRFEALVPPFRGRHPETGVVRLFRKSEEFDRYFAAEGTPLGLSSTAGLFSGSRRELVIRPVRRNSALDTGSIIRHEAFHQYLFSAWGGVEAPIWFNEGTAELFAGYVPRANGTFEFRELERRAHVLESLARDRDADWTRILAAVLLWDQETFYNPPVAGADANWSYSIGYGVCQFLHRGAPLMRGRPWKHVLPTLLETLERTGNPRLATAEAFQMGRDGRDLSTLSRFADDLRDYWKSESARRGSRSGKVP